MQASEVPRAVAAARSTASMLGLAADDAIVLNDSNRLVLRLLPCDSVARVAHIAHQAGAAFEVELARRLALTESPDATLDPRVAPQISVRDGFVVTLWIYYEPVPLREVAPADLETACRGPVEFDIVHAPEAVSMHYEDADQQLVVLCRVLMLAMIVTWRWHRDDDLPNGRQLGLAWLNELRAALERYGLDSA